MMSSSLSRLVRARVVLPLQAPPIEDGAVLVRGARLAKVGPWRDLRHERAGEAVDLGEVILLPGFINAHCHLDYTAMAGQITATRSFPDWIKAILALKSQFGYSEYAASWLRGARSLLSTGTTTVADIEAVPELLPEVRSATPLRVCSLLELTCVRSRRSPEEIVASAVARIRALPAANAWAGLSPHAPYSTTRALLECSATAARAHSWLAATHVAESIEEFEMCLQASGPMFDWLKPQRDMSDCGVGSPVQMLHRSGLIQNGFLAVHANYLAPGDARLLRQGGATVVHCPRSHAYFRHQPFPRGELEQHGVNICVGTDSLASTNFCQGEATELDMRAELRALSDQDPALSPEALVRLMTVNAARALGRAGELGELSESALADCVAIAFDGSSREAFTAVVASSQPVCRVMIGGAWCDEWAGSSSQPGAGG